MQYFLKNHNISVSICSKWAEINSFLYKNQEIIYQKQEGFWQRQSPILFPVVGGLKNKEYEWKGKKYSLPQHGFARDMEFECVFQDDSELHFLLTSNEQTRENYPFDFELYIRYFLREYSLKVEYEVKNIGNSEMYYSIGGHPAFQIRTDINRYLLKFEKNMENQRVDRIHPTEFLLDENYAETFSFGDEKNILPLNEEYFQVDAMIFRDIESKKVDFYFENNKLFSFEFENFPHLGIWKQPHSPFICLEPWAWYVDVINASGKLEQKDWIQRLDARDSHKYSWEVHCN